MTPHTELQEAILATRQAAHAPETRRTRREGWARWAGWARARGVPALPAPLDALEAFLVEQAEGGLAASTVLLTGWAVAAAHRDAGLPDPSRTEQIRLCMKGLRRRRGRPPRRARPLTIAEIARMEFPPTLRGRRDKALLLLGFAGALRKSELVALQVGDIEPARGGLLLTIRRSKTDQQGAGASVYVAPSQRFPGCCPVATLEAWLAAAGHTDGPLFRSVRGGAIRGALDRKTVDKIVRDAVQGAGLGEGYSAHSLRAGCATWLAACGVSVPDIARHGRWRRLDTVLIYCRGDTAAALQGAW